MRTRLLRALRVSVALQSALQATAFRARAAADDRGRMRAARCCHGTQATARRRGRTRVRRGARARIFALAAICFCGEMETQMRGVNHDSV